MAVNLALMENKYPPIINTNAIDKFEYINIFPEILLCSDSLFNFLKLSNKIAELEPDTNPTPSPDTILAIKNISNPLKKARIKTSIIKQNTPINIEIFFPAKSAKTPEGISNNKITRENTDIIIENSNNVTSLAI